MGLKTRVKATGEIVEVKSKVITSPVTGESLLKYVNQKTGVSYFEEELFFPKDLADDPNYWTRLEHQYAGIAMQEVPAGYLLLKSLTDDDIPDDKLPIFKVLQKPLLDLFEKE